MYNSSLDILDYKFLVFLDLGLNFVEIENAI